MDTDHIHFHEAKFIDQSGQLKSTKVPVVQDLARQRLKSVPERFIINDQPLGQVLDPGMSHTIPAIDMSKLQVGSELVGRAEELAKLASVAREWGMFLVSNHGITSSVLDDVKDVVKGFFELSFEEKKASVGSYTSVDNMGYGRNFVKSEKQPLDWIDRLTMKAAPKGASKGINVWPKKPASFRQVIENYVEEARKVLDELLQALAEALSLERPVFLQYVEPEKSEINVRINCYPPCPRPDLALGLTPHTDPSALTLLFQIDSSGGLQVFKDMKWLTVPWPEDTLLVNIGDLMEIMSNGMLTSPWHRVVTQEHVERFSVALFYNPPSEAEIEPVMEEKTCDKYYKKMVVGEYLQHFYKAIHHQGTNRKGSRRMYTHHQHHQKGSRRMYIHHQHHQGIYQKGSRRMHIHHQHHQGIHQKGSRRMHTHHQGIHQKGRRRMYIHHQGIHQKGSRRMYIHHHHHQGTHHQATHHKATHHHKVTLLHL